MSIISLIGIDPGLVDTGAVALTFNQELQAFRVDHQVIPGGSVDGVVAFVEDHRVPGNTHVFVEAYRDRGTAFSTHGGMRALEHGIKAAVPEAKVIDNTGVKQVVTRGLMTLFTVWDFGTATHHQDLRSAARIALYGALKDETLNSVLTAYALDILRKE